MNHRLFIVLIFFISWGMGFTQTNEFSDPEPEPDMLIGKVDRDMLQRGEFGNHFRLAYANYTPCPQTLQRLENNIYDISITIVLATWCSDSQIQVPRFYKILDQLDYKTNLINLICVDREKTGGSTNIASLEVDFVPTFIFYKNGEEIGRIIESPENSLETDALRILTN